MACRRRGAARGAPLRPRRCCGGCLRPGPPRWAPCPVLGPTAGPPPGLQKVGRMGGPLRGFAIARPRPGPPVGSGLGVAVAWPGVAPPPPRGRLAVRRGSARAVGALAWCALRPVLPRVPRRPPAALPPRCCGSPPRRPSPSFPSAWRSAALRRAGLRFSKGHQRVVVIACQNLVLHGHLSCVHHFLPV